MGRSGAPRRGAGAAGWTARDRALATRLAYGAVQRRATLDALAEELAGRPVERLDPAVRAALRLGLYQLAFLDRVPAHAVVGDAVELVKAESPGGAKLVNAVLRRAAPMAAGWVAGAAGRARPPRPRCATPTRAGSPRCGSRALGPDDARALMAALNEPAEAVLRANTLRTTPEELAERLGVPSHPAPGLPEGLVLDGAVRRLRLAAVGARACSCRSRAPRWRSPARSRRGRASACSTSAPRPAARRRTSRR